MGKLIRLFLVEDDPEGMRTLEISNLTVKATVFPRPLLNAFAKRDDAKKPGVYLLYADPTDDISKPMLYIGEGDPVLDRLKSHSAKKDFWTEAFVFTSKDGYLTKTQVQYLESRLISLAKEAGRVELDNVQLSTEPTISEVDLAEVQQFLASIQVLASALRLRFFEKLSISPIVPQVDEMIFEFRVKNYLGKMTIRDGKYVLLAGSTAAVEHRQSSVEALCRIRDNLVQNGILVLNGQGSYDLTKDVPFNSPSTAAAIVCGGNSNGLSNWKHQGKTLRDIEADAASKL